MAKSGKILKRKIITYVVTVVVTILVMVFLLMYMQTKGQAEYQKNMSLQPLLDEIVRT